MLATLIDEAWQLWVPEVLIAILVALGGTRLLTRVGWSKLRLPIALLGLYLLAVPITALLHAHGSPAVGGVRLIALVLATVSVIVSVGTLLFGAVGPRLRLVVPTIVADVLVAVASVVAVFVLASRSGFDLSGLIATSAVLTAVIGLALQDTLSNIAAGLALQVDGSIQVDDWIKVGDLNGRVAEMRWRFAAIETRNWETILVPNSTLVKNQVLVLGRRTGKPLQWRRWVFFNVDFRYSPCQVIDSVTEALRSAPIENVAPEPPPNCILMDVADSYCRFAVRYWLTDLTHDDPTDSVFRTRVYFALKRLGVSLAIPAQAVFVTTDTNERRQDKAERELRQRHAALGKIDLFATLSEQERELLASGMRHAPFAAGEPLTRQGAKANWLYVIVSGTASVRVARDGAEREVSTLGAGDFFGEMGLLTGEPRTATVVAQSDVDCYRVGKEQFQELLQKRPRLAEEVARVLARRRVGLDATREDLDAKDEHARVSMAASELVKRMRGFFGLN
jgi:small-conductance mechanosensitive channel/CRP-like cAMP-binding protein